MKTLFLLLTLLLSLDLSAVQPDRSICGKDDMEDMVALDDGMKRMSGAIGIIRFGLSNCTGTLIGKDLLLTAGHCHNECGQIKVTFGFLKGRQETFPCKEIVEYNDSGNMNQDYMILRLEGMPGVEWGWYDMASRVPKKNDKLLMIHHPGGLPMKASRANCFFDSIKAGMLYHSCDTNPGSSGAGIIVPDFEQQDRSRIIAVHSYGGCNEFSTNYNSGATITSLMNISPTIRALVKD